MLGRNLGVGLVAAAAAFTVGISTALGDGMMLARDPKIQLFEPRQDAILAWNGTEEILILRVVVRASQPTEALQVVPFPSEPSVSKGSAESFVAAARIINQSMGFDLGSLAVPSARSKPKAPTNEPAGEVTLHETIGLHDVTVAHVRSKTGFVEWVTKTMSQSGAHPIEVSPLKLNIIAKYVASGIEWFVFDRLQLSDQLGQTEPLQYRFKSSNLFYPLRITRVASASDVELTVLTKRPLQRFLGLEGHRVKRLHQPVTLPIEDVGLIHIDLARLFASSAEVCLRLWQIKDYERGFSKDLIAM